MSKQANKTMIGAFVLGAVALVVAGVLIFGSGKFLKERHTFVMYFDGSVKGLNEGAPVVFRGVKIGTVTDIKLRANPSDLSIEIPVFIEIESDRWESVGEHKRRNLEEAMKMLIERGLRAQLGIQSFVTGQLMVELDYHPDKPIRLVGTDTGYPEIPTVPTELEELVKRVEKVPIEEIFEKLHSAVEGIEEVINSPEVMESISSFDDTLDAVRKLVKNIDSYVDPLATGIEETMRDTQKLIRNADGKVGLLASTLESTAETAAAAVEQARKTLLTLEHTADEDSPLTQELISALNDLSDAARSIRSLADYLDRHPESLLRGKGGSK